MTLRMAEQRYGMSAEELRPHFALREVEFKPLNVSNRSVRATFIAADEALLRWTPAWELAHLAGTAQLRTQLGARVEDWVPEPGMKANRPDAIWQPGEQVVAVEFDAGYPPKVVREKLRTFADFDQVVWGTPSPVRASHLRSRYASSQREFVVTDITASVAAQVRSAALGAG